MEKHTGDDLEISKSEYDEPAIALNESNAIYYYLDRFYKKHFSSLSKECKISSVLDLLTELEAIPETGDLVGFLTILSKISSITIHEHNPYSMNYSVISHA